MQDAVDALKIAFAVLIFIIALTIAFSSISQAKQASDSILYTIDKTNFYEQLNASSLEDTNGGRKVKIDTIISNIYKVPKESLAVKVIAGTDTFIFDLSTMNKADLYREIQRFKNAYMNTNLEFIENFSEITYTGKYIAEEDGSVITETPGLTKIYITYTKKS